MKLHRCTVCPWEGYPPPESPLVCPVAGCHGDLLIAPGEYDEDGEDETGEDSDEEESESDQ